MSVMKRLSNPILVNELRLRMRSRFAPWAITLYLAILGGLTFTLIYFMTRNQMYFDPQRSRELFMTLSILQFALIGVVTPGLTAGIISGEREKQTLDILLITNSSATKIILGKWLSSLSFIIFLVMSSIPLYSIIFLFGGISPAQMVQVFLMYIISIFVLGSLGILFSTIFKRTGVATVSTYGFILVYVAGTFIAANIIREILRPRSNLFWPEFLFSINPLTAIINIFDQGPFGGGSQSALPVDANWMYFIVFGSVTVIFLLLAIYLIKPVRPNWLRNKGRKSVPTKTR